MDKKYKILLKVQNGKITGFLYDHNQQYLNISQKTNYGFYKTDNPKIYTKIKINESTPESLGFKKIDR